MPTFSANLRSNKITCVKYCWKQFARLNGIYRVRICFVQLLRSKGSRKWGETPWKFSEKRKKFLPQKRYSYNWIRLLHVEKKYARNFHRFFAEPVRISQQCLNHVVLIIRTAPLHIPVCIDLIRKTKKIDAIARTWKFLALYLYLCSPASKTDHIRLIRKLLSRSIAIRLDCSCKVLVGLTVSRFTELLERPS